MMLAQLAVSVLLYEKVRTTEAKAKAVRAIVERAIARGRENTLTSRRYLLSMLPSKSAVDKVLEVLGPKYKERKGGYTRIVKAGRRKGDGAPIVFIELV